MPNPKQAAQVLLNRRTANAAESLLSAELSPQCLSDAFAIHREMEKSKPLVGWKCLLPPDSDKAIAAPIFHKGNFSDSQCRLIADKARARVEPEIAFVLAQDLPAREQAYTEAEIEQALESAHMALELMQDRYAEGVTPSFNERLADCLFNQGVFIGPEIDFTKAKSANEVKIKLTQSSSSQTFSGQHPNGGAILPVYWFVNYMREMGVDLKAGQAIITGSFCGIVELEFNQITQISYQGLGDYQVEFVE